MKGASLSMKRVGAKGEGRFERISWDEALAEIAERFRAVARSPHGPQAILPYSYFGTMGKLQASGLDRRFFHRLGASKLDRTICASAGTLGYEYTVGRGRLSADPLAVPRKPLTATAQVRMCGNSVSPPQARSLVVANFAHELVMYGEAA